ncbi:MAG: HEAT repeat domain-containing protein [Deltaproteobacteria bacterium]|nr:HEAT repeat domain-containing protein [Deltaproteobacteria bacterium]
MTASSSACRWGAALLCACACTKGPPEIVVGSIALALPPALDNDAATREGVRAQVAARLADSAGVRFAPDRRHATHRLALDVEEIVRLPGSGRELRPVRVHLAPLAGGVDLATVGAGLPLLDVVASAITGFDDAWAVIKEERMLTTADDRALIASLAHPDRRVRDFVIQALGARRARQAVSSLCERLTVEPQPELVLRIIGALVAIGDNAAAEPLIELARDRSPALVVQIAYALGSLGGTVAEGYLVTLASGHPLPEVREAAAAALKDLAAKPRR